MNYDPSRKDRPEYRSDGDIGRRIVPGTGPTKQKRRIFPKIFWTVLILALLILGVVFAKAYNFSSKVFVNRTSFFKKVTDLVFNNGTALKGESDNQINILLLGYGGVGHDGPYLTDTIIVASINPSTKQVTLTSVPRDYWWQFPSGTSKKINNAYSDGFVQNNSANDGGQYAIQAISGLTGLNIPYFVSMDFTGFKDAVDKVGGLDIDVDETFTDYSFPNDATNGYLPPLTFTQGMEHMNGTRALEYARSRHAAGNEGSDFARSARQKKVIEAFQTKISSLGITDTAKINSLISILANHLTTNLDPDELLHLVQMLKGNDYKVYGLALDPTTGLICPKTQDDGEYSLVPCDGVSDSDIRNFFIDAPKIAGIKDEGAKVILERAGATTAHYNDVKTALLSAGVTVYELTYKGLPLDKSALYEVHSEPLTEHLIEDKLKINSQPKPPEMTVTTSDLVLLVGSN